MLESHPLRLGETCQGNALTVDLCMGWAECLEYGQSVKKTGVFYSLNAAPQPLPEAGVQYKRRLLDVGLGP